MSPLILRNSVEQAEWLLLNVTQRANALRDLSDPLYDAASFKGHRFHVYMGGFKPKKIKNNTLDRTISGAADNQIGFIVYEGSYVITCKETLSSSDDPNDGTYGDLDAYYMLNNPSPTVGEPNNLITLVDFDGVERAGFLIGDQAPDPLTTLIKGVYAYYTVPIQFVQRDAIG